MLYVYLIMYRYRCYRRRSDSVSLKKIMNPSAFSTRLTDKCINIKITVGQAKLKIKTRYITNLI